MDVVGGASPSGPRGRVVMLVHNAVTGDSRVQKVARSAAEAGWDVVLLGRSPDRHPQTWDLGGAQVRLLPMTSPLTKRRHEFRRPWLRAPLAYPPTGIAAYRHQWVRAWRADLAVRQALLTLDERRGAARPVRRLWLRAEGVAARLTGGWVGLRYRQLNYAQRSRRRLTGWWDRLQARLWIALKGDRAWRRLEPRLWDFELTYGPVIDELRPDIIHAHDFRMLGVGARAAIRGQAQGRPVKLVWDAHEFLPGVSPGSNTVRWLPAHAASEREYARFADAVVTVSDRLGDLLRAEHGLTAPPTVVLNAPNAVRTADERSQPVPDLRADCGGLDPDVPLLVYCGGAVEHRGLGIMVEALPHQPGVHVALIVPNLADRYVTGLVERAGELGVAERLHILPYVPYFQVPDYLAGADVGVIPIQHWPNHEIALITKFFEYSHARLPIVVSDVKTMAETVRTTGQGEVFTAEDLHDYRRAVTAVLTDPKRYRAAYDQPGLLDQWTWETQARTLDALYQRLIEGHSTRSPAT